MRLTLVTCWLTLCWLAPVLLAEPTATQEAKSSSQTSHHPPSALLWKTSVPGLGDNRFEAEQIAYQLAGEKVRDWMRSRHPHFRWIPSREYLEQSGIAHKMKAVSGEQVNDKVELFLEITDQQHDALLEQGKREQVKQLRIDKKHRMEERHWLWGKLLAAGVLLLALFGGYLRLEDATQGYLTHALRGALLVGVAGTLAALYFLL